jgi:hypothetical protein
MKTIKELKQDLINIFEENKKIQEKINALYISNKNNLIALQMVINELKENRESFKKVEKVEDEKDSFDYVHQNLISSFEKIEKIDLSKPRQIKKVEVKEIEEEFLGFDR